MRRKTFWYMTIISAVCAFLSSFVCALAGVIRSHSIEFLPMAAVIGIAVFLLGILLSGILSRRIVIPIVRDLGVDSEAVYEEISPLVKRLEEQRLSIRQGVAELEEREHGLRMVMENMQEGIIMLGGNGLILSINKGAIDLLELKGGDFIGMHMVAVSTNQILHAVVYTALAGSADQELIETSTSTIQLMGNPVRVDGEVRGVVLLLFDVTEKHAAEQMRREFSANVSHELKTPLTSISGYAEIMKDGLVKAEDIQRFSSNIYDEARRLIALIEDIIRISRLDEGGLESSDVKISLLELATGIAERLSDKAEEYDVKIGVTGDNAYIFGNAQLLDEMIYNLCDNAIKYNKPKGNVSVEVVSEADHTSITVRDTGIGIPREHQPRVFERFYRVDKSHSKETGGTGLGLSIVKHGAIYHKASVELESTPGEGTSIRLCFEKIDG